MAAEKKVGIGIGHTDFEELLPLATWLKKSVAARPSIIRCSN